MKVSTKIIAGYAVLVLLMTGALGYELSEVQRMRAISSELSEVSLRAAFTGIELREGLRDVDEWVSKYLTVDLEGWDGSQFESVARSFEQVLERMDGLDLTGGQAAGRESLKVTWAEFRQAVRTAETAQDPGSYDFLPVGIEDQLRRMYSQVEIIFNRTLAGVDRELVAAAAISDRATRVSWLAAAAALLLASGVAFVIVRSISGGLGELTEGTEFLASGQFQRRIREDRNDEFGQLARQFNRMADDLEKLDRMKKDFVSSVSHELKSPIASAREIVQLLIDEVPGPLNTEQRRLLELSVRSSRRLSSMVGTLLDLARMDAGTMTYEMRVENLAGLVRATLEEFEVAVRERGLEIETALNDDLPAVRCDADRIVQVLGNVIDNAMKFAPRGSRIRITTDREGSGVRVSVADSGPGIPDGFKARVFERFQQVRSEEARHGHGGTGLGLAICREIMDAHGGAIRVDDHPGGGSVFRIVVPIVTDSRDEVQHVEVSRPIA